MKSRAGIFPCPGFSIQPHLKKGIKKKEQFPNEQSLNRYVCVLACEYNVKYAGISHYGFSMAKEELENMIEEIYIN